ncbi:MAG: hypothetical protein NTW02_05655 [Cyanobium sp. LacPavin_0920_WC12_MAG_62_9]|nr:hypothetical protein [Cyanobium sp. LacPavin_0920_WC12_MAG_62_9]
MKDARAALGMALAALMAVPAGSALASRQFTPEVPVAVTTSADSLVARGGGRGGGGGRASGGRAAAGGNPGGGAQAGNRSANRSASRANNGFGNAGAGLNRGSTRPSGGWSNQVKPGASTGPSLDRANRPNRDRPNRDAIGSGSFDRNRDLNGNRDINRNWNRQVNINNVVVRPGWARPGWGVARPWNYGWYGVSTTPAWGWWGARAALWGVGTLATAAIINNAVDDAISDNYTTIVVPNSDYSLYYGSVQPSGQSAVSFVVQADGNDYQLSADCNAGTINGEEPKTAAQAELLNAACQVAFGST